MLLVFVISQQKIIILQFAAMFYAAFRKHGHQGLHGLKKHGNILYIFRFLLGWDGLETWFVATVGQV